MGDLLEHLGKDTLPELIAEMFSHWCVWEQARPALVTILRKVDLAAYAQDIEGATDLQTVTRLAERANIHIKALQGKTTPLGMSAAEAGTFEFTNMANAADERNLDAEAVAFFAARVVGWAGWAAGDFTDPTKKGEAEKAARADQERKLETLINDTATSK